MYTTSASLLERLRQPSEKSAWERFVELYTPLLYQWANRLGERGPDGADLVQDVFVVLLDELPAFQYDRQRRFRGWLWTVLLNKHRERRRRTKHEPQVSAPDRLPDRETADPAAIMEEAEYRQYLVARCLELMKEEFHRTTWQACFECVVEGRSAADVARSLGMTVNAVYLAKSRALRWLHQELDGLLDANR